MSLPYIRKTYGVPAKRGGRIRFTPYGKESARVGTITGSINAHLRVRFDGEKKSSYLHPDFGVEYLPTEALPIEEKP